MADTTPTVIENTCEKICQETNGIVEEKVDLLKLGTQHLCEGKRHLIIKDYSMAVASLAISCDMLQRHYGDTAIECFDAYFNYGKALLELARMENEVIENGLDGCPLEDDGEAANNSLVEDPEKCTEEEKKQVVQQVEGALQENFESCLNVLIEKEKVEANDEAEEKVAPAEGDATEVASDEDAEDEDMDEEPEETGEAEETDEAAAPTRQDNEAEAENQAEDLPSLQLAWEILDLVKVILNKRLESIKSSSVGATEKDNLMQEVETKICDSLQLLAEVASESETFPRAIEDFGTCLKLRQKLLPDDSRCLAETHYQLAVAQEFNNQFEDSIESMNLATNAVKKRISNLKVDTASTDPKKVVVGYTRESEIKELELLLPEMEEKLADIKQTKHDRIDGAKVGRYETVKA